MLSTDVDKLKFVRRLNVAAKFPANSIQMWISTQQVNYYFFTSTSRCVFGLKEKTNIFWFPSNTINIVVFDRNQKMFF
jgi:hypothetical protein